MGAAAAAAAVDPDAAPCGPAAALAVGRAPAWGAWGRGLIVDVTGDGQGRDRDRDVIGGRSSTRAAMRRGVMANELGHVVRDVIRDVIRDVTRVISEWPNHEAPGPEATPAPRTAARSDT